MSRVLVYVAIGFALGWGARTFYTMWLWEASASLRRRARGRTRRRRRH